MYLGGEMRVRVWYTDRVYDVTSFGEWKALPEIGVVVVAESKETGVTKYDSGDWYWMDREGLHKVPSRDWGTWEPRPEGIECYSCIKKGAAVSDAEFQRVTDEVMVWH